jgi:hypothetical protein
MTETYCNGEPTHASRLVTAFALLCFVTVALLAPAGPVQASGTKPEGLSSGEWAAIQAQVAARSYRAYPGGNNGFGDGFVASNPSHGWRIHYAADGTTTLTPRKAEGEAYALGLRLRAVGYSDAQTLAQPQEVSASDATVTYQWNDNVREWWVNSGQDLEQWFELERRPEGGREGENLVLSMALATDLAASQQVGQSGNELSFVGAGGTVITYNKLKAWDATGRELPASMQLSAGQLNLVINDNGASYPLTIDPSFQQQAYVKASNTQAYDKFGSSVAISGDTLVIGAFEEDSFATGINGDQGDNSALSAGAVYVFTRVGTTWSQQAYLKASNSEEQDSFGWSVAISGDTLAVGAFLEDSKATGINGDQADDAFFNAGAVYVFHRSGTEWTQQAYLKASNTGGGDQFGTAMAISGNTLVVSSPLESSKATGINGDGADNSAVQSGAVYVFIRSGTIWSQQAYVKASNTQGGDGFGKAVALSADTLVVGARGEGSKATGINGNQGDNTTAGAGAVYVFVRSGATWSQQAYIKASNTEAGDQFGWAVAVSGDTLVASAPYEDSKATGINGLQTDNTALQSGAVYIFSRAFTAWSQQAYVKASNTEAGDFFGTSVALSPSMLVVGATYDASNATGVNGNQSDNSAYGAGAAYAFTRNISRVWSQQAYLKASNTAKEDFFGVAMAISGDTLVVTAPYEDGGSSGVNGDENSNSAAYSGSAYVFTDLSATFEINPGLNDAWFNPDTRGQGFFINVFPDNGNIFLGWFTFDTERPPADVTAILGDPGARWLTAFGAYAGNQAVLDIELTYGGVFDSQTPIPAQSAYGTVILEFSSCNAGTVTYDIPSLSLSGVIPIQRATLDNVELCEDFYNLIPQR